MTNSCRHTFNYLDNFLPINFVNSLDNYFKELDVLTYMVEGKTKNMAARAGYHSLRSLAIATQAVAYAAFVLIKNTALFVYNLGAFCIKAIVLFITMPISIKRKFFPSAVERLETRITNCNKAIENKCFTKELMIGPKKNEISHDEKKELMDCWLVKTLDQARVQPLYQELIHLLDQFANRDFGDDLLTESKTRIEEIIKDENLSEEFGNLPLMVKTFIQVFENESDFEKSITTEDIQKDFSILLKHPSLLKRDNIDSLIEKAPSKIRDKIIRKKTKVLHRSLFYAHQQEKKFLLTIPHLLTPFNINELKQKYSSITEEGFLEQRLEWLDKQLEAFRDKKEVNSFAYLVCQLEKQHLLVQQNKMQKANEILQNLEDDDIINDANQINKNYLILAYEKLNLRFNLSLETLQNDEEIKPECVDLFNQAIQLAEQFDEENIQKAFEGMNEIIGKLQKLEMSLIQRGKVNSTYLKLINSHLITYEDYYKKISAIHEKADPWIQLQEITSFRNRDEERQNNVAKDVISLILETKPECQVPLLIIKKDIRSQSTDKKAEVSSIVHKKIAEAAQDFVDSVSNQYLDTIKSRLLSFTEFASMLRQGQKLNTIEDVLNEKINNEKVELDFTAISLDYSKNLDKWYAQLQDIWVEHMPREQEEQLLALWGRNAKEVKMSELFSVWFEKLTGKKLHASLSFSHIRLPDNAKTRDAAIEQLDQNLKGSPRFNQFITHTRQNIVEAKQSQPKNSELKGFDSELMGHAFRGPKPAPTIPKIDSQFVDFQGSAKEFDSIIATLDNEHKAISNRSNGLTYSIDWVKALSRSSTDCKSLRLMILAECRKIIEACNLHKIKVPDDIQDIFLDQFSIESENGKAQLFDFKNMNNLERSYFLASLLEMIFTEKKPVTLLETERAYLIQLLSLSLLSKDRVEAIISLVTVGNSSSDLALSSLIEKVGKQLQASPIGLEGVEESTLQQSFLKANLPRTPSTRFLLDSYRARSGESLSFYLLNYVYEANQNLGHDQQREAIARALIHAYSCDPQKTGKYIQEKIAQTAKDQFNKDTLAAPLYIFYGDLFRQLDLAHYFSTPLHKDEMSFNQTLIESKDVNKMLMGYARTITSLSFKAKYLNKQNKPLSDNDMYQLFRSKVAYEHLILNYFDEKQEARGFLKIEMNLAKMAIVMTAEIIQNWLNDPNHLENLSDNMHKLHFKDYADEVIKRELGRGTDVQKFTFTNIPGFIALGPKITIDAITGVIYNDGRQQINLPPHLQNHPAVRTLGVHNFPYTWDPLENAFIFYIIEDEKSIPQMLVKEVNGRPVIQRRLANSFKKNRVDLLQFVPKESITLPISALHRMEIHQFWQDKRQNLFGYNKGGNLVAVFKKTYSSGYVIQNNKEEKYLFLSNKIINNSQDNSVLQGLVKCFNPNEILVAEDLKTYFIPALGLKLKEELDKFGDIQWVCECRGMAKKNLDLATLQSSSLLIFKNNISEHKSKPILQQLKETRYRLKLMVGDGLSNVDKHKIKELEKHIKDLEQKLVDLEDSLYLGTLPDQASDENLVQSILEKIPSDYSDEFEEIISDIKITKPYEVFPKALLFLDQELTTIYKTKNHGKIAELLNAYQAIQREYEKICDRSLEIVFFKKSSEGLAQPNNLTGALTILVNQLEIDDDSTFLHLIKELSKYPLVKSLTDSQVLLLNSSLAKLQNSPVSENALLLTAYLQFMLYQHYLFKACELSVMSLSNTQDSIQAIEKSYNDLQNHCQITIQTLSDQGCNLPKELLALWKKTHLLPDHALLQEPNLIKAISDKKVKSSFAEEIQFLGSQTLLERLSATDVLQAIHKDPEKNLSPHQKDLSNSFYQHSPLQVEGFYFEKMGYFSLNGLYDEFRVDPQTEKALYGLNKDDVKNIFNFLKKQNYIKEAKNASRFYCLNSADKATTGFQAHQLRALLTHLSLTDEQIHFITERLKTFLFRAMQSGFEFSFKNGLEKELDKKLIDEKEIHLQKYLDAEAILKKDLQDYDASFIDLKYAILSGNYSKFSQADTEENNRRMHRLSNAMIRYLFHKTEVQHIENILKAPMKGERNKIQLLQTKRNYSVDFLLQSGLKGEERQEQIMQRAYLAFEEDYGNRCNLMQIRMFRSLMLDINHEDAINASQARMGFGKTALLPLIAIVRVALERTVPEEDKHLVRYIVPRAVIEDNTSSFNQRLSAILGKNVVQDRNFARYQLDKENPKASFKWILLDLESRLNFYKEVKKQGDVLIQWPEIRCSMEAQDLDFGEIIASGNLPDEALDLCIKAKQLLVQIRSIPTYSVFDELDDTQDITSREVNFTRGQKMPIPQSSIRPLEKLITYIETHKDKNWTDMRARAREMVTALCTELNGSKIVACPEEVIDYLVDRREPLNDRVKGLLSQSLVDAANGPHTEHTENDSLLILIRMVLLDSYILDLIRSKQPNTHFGVRFVVEPKSGERIYFNDPNSESALLIAVPYEGTNTPKGLSIFDNTEVAAITTMRYYHSKETHFAIKPHLDFLIKQMQKGSIPDYLIEHYFENNQRECAALSKELRNMAGMLDIEELREAKEKFYHKFMREPSKNFRKFFACVVVATQIHSDEACAKSDRYEKGSTKDIVLGCSGTVGDTSSYFTKQAPDPAADGTLSIEIMGRDNNSSIKWLTPPKDNEDYLKATLSTLLDQTQNNTRGIVDIAGICKSRDGSPEAVIEELWQQLKSRKHFSSIEGIIYYGKDNIKRLYRGNSHPIPCTTAMELAALGEKKYFSFYKQKNGRGSDIKQAHGTHVLVTLDENVSNSDAKQAILRFRDLVNPDSKQTFSFAAVPSFKEIVIKTLKDEIEQSLVKTEQMIEQCKQEIDKASNSKEDRLKAQDALVALNVHAKKIRDRLKKIPDIELQTKDIANYLRIEEKNSEEKNAITIFRKEMKAHLKEAAGHLEASLLAKLPLALNDQQKANYIQFLKDRNNISQFVERSINTLYLKYGTSTNDQQRNNFIKKQKKLTIQKLKELYALAETFAQNNNIEIEIEKEFYEELIERSIENFKKRFDKNKAVQVSNVQSNMVAVAEAVAEAQAEALAEAVAEVLSQSFTEVLDRAEIPKIVMVTQRKNITLDYLTNPSKLTNIANFEPMKHLVRPDLRNAFSVSPVVENMKLVAHFVLVNKNSFIFISQEEADLFEKKSKNRSFNPQGYVLYDARNSQKSIDGIHTLPTNDGEKQIPCVVLGHNDVPNDIKSITTTENLRKTSLINVTSAQLLPTLSVTASNEINNYLKIGAFGITKDIKFAIHINPSGALKPLEDHLTIRVNSGVNFSETISIPRKNELVVGAIQKEFQTTNKKKITNIHNDLTDTLEKIAPQLAELKKKTIEIEKLNNEDRQSIANVKIFELSKNMTDGLTRRDGDSDFKGFMSKIGSDTIEHCQKIVNIQAELKKDPSLEKLKQLQTLFKEFVSDDMLNTAATPGFDIKKSLLISQEVWNEKKDYLEKNYQVSNKQCDQVPLLTRVYGRIVHEVHSNKPKDAAECPLEDCRNMFSQVIPDLIKTIPSINETIDSVKIREAERIRLQEEIQLMKQQNLPLIEALDFIEQILKIQDNIEEGLKNCGLHINKGEFFDQFLLGNFVGWLTEFKADIQGTLPDYHNVVEKDMVSYAIRIKALTPNESAVQQKNKQFLQQVLSLAKLIEDRSSEITFHLS